MFAVRLQPAPEHAYEWMPAASGSEPVRVTSAVAAGLLLLVVSAACTATVMSPGEPDLAANPAATLLSVYPPASVPVVKATAQRTFALE